MKKYYIKGACLLALLLFCSTSFSAIYYVANTGNDVNAGTITSPFLSIQRAQTAVVAGDTVYVRGGTFTMAESQIAQYTSIWAYVTLLNKSGTSGKRINYWAYPGEKPVFNYTAVNPAGYRIHAFQVTGSWIHIKGLEVVGVQVNITAHTQSECFENQGSNNIYEMLSMHDGKAIGFYLTKGGNNLILNCDAYNNWDNVSENQLGGNTDGFGFHANNDGVGYTNNIFRGCRAWFNSDDGFDCINAFEAVRFENCWAFYNGYSGSFASLGDGNGFKAGGYGVSTAPSVPTVIPRNTIQFCLAVRNKANGFYANHHLGGNNWYNNSAYYNATNYNMLNRTTDYTADIAGYDHNMKNNLGWGGRSTEYSNINFTSCNADTNAFNLPVTINSADFLSTDMALLTTARNTDGSLPNINFMQLAANSDAIDKGLNIGFAYNGTAPDLGCFESNYNALPAALLSFTAFVNKQNAVVLNWQIIDQLNNKGWEIERCLLNNTAMVEWKKVGFVAANEMLAGKSFSYTDVNLLSGNTYQYRLKQIDNDGSFKYSKILIVKLISDKSTGLRVYPNPIQENSVVQYNLNKPSIVQLSVYNLQGGLIKQWTNATQQAGMQFVQLNQLKLPINGNCVIRLKHNETEESLLLIK